MDNTTKKMYDDFLRVKSDPISMMDPSIINTASPFKDLFPIRPAELEHVMESMKTDGYDNAHPIILWAGHNTTVVDGHTRLAAANKLLFAEIPVILREFKDEAEALEYAIKSQVNRRNLDDAELLRCLDELDKRKKTGPGKGLASRDAKPGKSAEQTAKLLGVSQAKVERLRTVNDHASDEIKEAVKSGEMSANKAYKATMEARHAAERAKADPEEIKSRRLVALEDSICGTQVSRIDRELKEYPEVRYSDDEIDELTLRIAAKLKLALQKLKGNN